MGEGAGDEKERTDGDRLSWKPRDPLSKGSRSYGGERSTESANRSPEEDGDAGCELTLDGLKEWEEGRLLLLTVALNRPPLPSRC